MDFEGKKSFSFIWRIENFSCCLHKPSEELVSPEFTIKSLSKSRWTVKVYPGGIDGYLDFRLVNTSCCEYILHYQISLVDSNGSVVNTRKKKNERFRFNSGRGVTPFPTLKEVYQTKRSTYLPQDTLIIFCRLWKEGDMEEDMQCFARTRIGVERISKLWSVQEDFSKLRLKQVFRATVSDPNCSNYITLKLLSDTSVHDNYLPLQIVSEEFTSEFSILYEILHLNLFGKIVKKSDRKYKILPSKERVWTLKEFLSKRELNGNRSDPLFQDVLCLKFEFTISFGKVVYDKIESSHIGLPTLLIPELKDLITNFREPSSSAVCPSTLDTMAEDFPRDLLSLYREKTLCDFELKCDDVAFPVHKAILRAQSPVFKTMLTTMLEGDTKSLIVPDIDADTMTKLLMYLYTDTFENTNLGMAFKLYCTADKYQILSLKKKCSSVLKSNLTVPNVTAILGIADKYEDDELASAVYDFILDHDGAVEKSADWLELQKSNHQLTRKTMYHVFSKSLQRIDINQRLHSVTLPQQEIL